MEWYAFAAPPPVLLPAKAVSANYLGYLELHKVSSALQGYFALQGKRARIASKKKILWELLLKMMLCLDRGAKLGLFGVLAIFLPCLFFRGGGGNLLWQNGG